ncbi:uncharacterized protein LOC106369492 [Brassica napus]|uniref:uncharacterized protein LOC106369492 n=1 Tax=Brassica napus TaxID=3708 RepID=UPI002078B7FC|nr:uncharacterized protein LOC106369492 [Brassica napus]
MDKHTHTTDGGEIPVGDTEIRAMGSAEDESRNIHSVQRDARANRRQILGNKRNFNDIHSSNTESADLLESSSTEILTRRSFCNGIVLTEVPISQVDVPVRINVAEKQPSLRNQELFRGMILTDVPLSEGYAPIHKGAKRQQVRQQTSNQVRMDVNTVAWSSTTRMKAGRIQRTDLDCPVKKKSKGQEIMKPDTLLNVSKNNSVTISQPVKDPDFITWSSTLSSIRRHDTGLVIDCDPTQPLDKSFAPEVDVSCQTAPEVETFTTVDESDEEDSGDEYWDCSSNDADDLNSDSDIDENGTLAQRQQRQLYINKVSECFSNSFGGNTQSNAITSVSGPPTRKEEGGKIDNSINTGKGPKVFKMHGENYHLIGSVKPKPNETAKFSQLYIHDTENEVQNRLSALSGNKEKSKIRADLVKEIMEMLRACNVHVKSFRNVMDRFNDADDTETLSLVLLHTRLQDGRVTNLPTASEVAALVVGDFRENMDKRDIILEKTSGKLKRINELHPCYLPMQYPLIFPYGEDGFRLGIKNGFTGITKNKKPNISMREFFSYRIMIRKVGSHVLLLSRRLLQQFLVDAYTMIESHRLRFIRKNQAKLRTLKFSKFVAAANEGHSNVSIEGNRIILPASFTGGPRYMHQMYLDAMTICKYFGFPSLFITFTCNPKWPELERYMQKFNLKAEDRPELCCRLFKIKLDRLMDDLTKKYLLGKTVAAIYTVEFQKRGLPHAHILLFMDALHKLPGAEDIDRIISAEIPDKESEPRLYEVVKNMMIHGPCGVVNRGSPCMVDGRCSKFFPRNFVETTTVDAQGYPVYRRRDNGAFIEKKGIKCDNRFVVPYNKELLLSYNAHINVEWCNQSRSIKYLFKYINKGQDRVTATITQKSTTESAAEGNTDASGVTAASVTTNASENVEPQVDEIKKYFEARYISSCEATWRILAFPTHYRSTPVEKLTFHLEGEQPVIYREGDTVSSVMERSFLCKTMFLAWFECCIKYPEARELTYAQMPTRFVYDAKQKEWNPRKKGFAIGRLAPVSPGSGPQYYLRVLINKVKGPTCYADIRTVNGVIHPSYEDACFDLGLLDDDKEYIEGLKECSFWASSGYARKLFAKMLISDSLSMPKLVWEETKDILSEDVLYMERKKRRNPGLILTEEEILNSTLIMIETILRQKNTSLDKWTTMPKPVYNCNSLCENQLLQDELNYPRDELRVKHAEWLPQMTDEQRSVYEEIISAVINKKGGVFFVYGFGGTGKTFMWNILSAAIRSKGDVVLNVASSGIASLLLPGGRTAHSRFGIPINPDESSTCNIQPGSDQAEVIEKSSLIIWDEAPMMSRHCFEALDRSLGYIMKTADGTPYGGKVVVFGGDFRQILPVIPRGNRADIVMATLNYSYLWKHCKVLQLSKNMRLLAETNIREAEEIKEFSDWILALGDGRINEPNSGEVLIDIPKDLLIKEANDPIRAIVSEVYGNTFKDSRDPIFFQERAILCPTNADVEVINNYMLDQLTGEEKIYLSSDSIDPTDTKSQDDSIFSPEFLNSIKTSGLPNHTLRLRVGTPVMILRNIDPEEGLCNGTRLQITQLANHILQAKVITGTRVGEIYEIKKPAIRVQVISKWRTTTSETELLVVDEMGSKIQGTFHDECMESNKIIVKEDIYGSLVFVGNLEFVEVAAGIVKPKTVFSLINPEYSPINCVAYGTTAVELLTYWNSRKANVVLCVLSVWQIERDEGGFRFMTNIEGCSKIVFEPNIPEIEEFRKKIPPHAY